MAERCLPRQASFFRRRGPKQKNRGTQSATRRRVDGSQHAPRKPRCEDSATRTKECDADDGRVGAQRRSREIGCVVAASFGLSHSVLCNLVASAVWLVIRSVG